MQKPAALRPRVTGADYSVLGLLPARGGSKTVPRKNIALVRGRPMIAYTIEATLAVEVIDWTVVSTDDEEIAEIARGCGALVPFLRPPELAGDQTPMFPVVEHALRQMEDELGTHIDIVALMQPDGPLKRPEDIAGCIEKLVETGADSVMSMVRVTDNHPALMKRLEGDRIVPFSAPEREGTRKQDYRPRAYKRAGGIYVGWRDAVLEKRSLWGTDQRAYLLEPERAASVDHPIDLCLVECLMRYFEKSEDT